MAGLGLVLVRLSARAGRLARPEAMVTLGLLALLVAPAAWGGMAVWNAPGDALPAAGPNPLSDTGRPGAAGQTVVVGTGRAEADPKLVAYLLANRGGARYLVATDSAGGASPLILATGQPVLALHGFGADEILSVDQLADLVASGAVRFFLTPSPEAPPGQTTQAGAAPHGVAAGDPGQDDLMGWVREHCRPVPADQWQSPGGASSADQLYDCAGAGR